MSRSIPLLPLWVLSGLLLGNFYLLLMLIGDLEYRIQHGEYVTKLLQNFQTVSDVQPPSFPGGKPAKE
jgi:hypothetical protein